MNKKPLRYKKTITSKVEMDVYRFVRRETKKMKIGISTWLRQIIKNMMK
jgi:hypothetical protein